MIDALFKRRPARDFLRKYPTTQWKEIIPDVFEIGVLNLRNSFNTYEFSKTDLQNILLELRNSRPNRTVKVSNINDPMSSMEFQDTLLDRTFPRAKRFEEEKIFDELKKRKHSPARTEVYVSELNHADEKNYPEKYRFLTNTNRPRMPYYRTQEEIKLQNFENKRNLEYKRNEMTKTREDMIKDKMMYDALKNNKNVSMDYMPNNANRSASKEKNKLNNSGHNYIINFDKNFNEESTEEKKSNKPSKKAKKTPSKRTPSKDSEKKSTQKNDSKMESNNKVNNSNANMSNPEEEPVEEEEYEEQQNQENNQIYVDNPDEEQAQDEEEMQDNYMEEQVVNNSNNSNNYNTFNGQNQNDASFGQSFGVKYNANYNNYNYPNSNDNLNSNNEQEEYNQEQQYQENDDNYYDNYNQQNYPEQNEQIDEQIPKSSTVMATHGSTNGNFIPENNSNKINDYLKNYTKKYYPNNITSNNDIQPYRYQSNSNAQNINSANNVGSMSTVKTADFNNDQFKYMENYNYQPEEENDGQLSQLSVFRVSQRTKQILQEEMEKNKMKNFQGKLNSDDELE